VLGKCQAPVHAVYHGALNPREETSMVICPIAIVAGCEKCPAFKVCPLTKVLGDQKDAKADAPAKSAAPETKGKKKA
jgi:hypothetical protein